MDVNANTVATLYSYRRLARDKTRRVLLLKDQALLSFLVYVMDDEATDVLRTALEILILLSEEKESGRIVANAFGLDMALDKLKGRPPSHDISRLIDILEQRLSHSKLSQDSLSDDVLQPFSVPNSTKSDLIDSKCKSPERRPLRFITKSKTKPVTLQLDNLSDKDRSVVEAALLAVKGIVSIYFDHCTSRCVVRVKSHISAETIGLAVLETKLTAVHIVKKFDDGEEELTALNESMPCSQSDNVSDHLPEYLAEHVGSSPSPRSAAKCVARVGQAKTSKRDNGWFGQVTSFLSNTLW